MLLICHENIYSNLSVHDKDNMPEKETWKNFYDFLPPELLKNQKILIDFFLNIVTKPNAFII